MWVFVYTLVCVNAYICLGFKSDTLVFYPQAMRRTKTSVAQRFVLTNKRQTDLNIRNKGSHSGLDKKNERRTDEYIRNKG